MVKTEEKSQRVYLVPRVIPYLEPLQGDKAKGVYEATRELAKEHVGFPGLEGHFRFNEEAGRIEGSNLAWLVLTNEVLAREKARTPTVSEFRTLEERGLLTSGVYRDMGLVVYSGKSPNESIAKKIEEEAKRRGWSLPVIAHPLNLTLSKDRTYGLKEDAALTSDGESAKGILSQFSYLVNSGARRLVRVRSDDWIANWDGFSDSYDVGRVDFVRREASRNDSEAQEAIREIEEASARKLEEYASKLRAVKEKALADLGKL